MVPGVAEKRLLCSHLQRYFELASDIMGERGAPTLSKMDDKGV